MADGLETELKLAASPAMLLHLRDHPLLAGEESASTLVARYFDTPGGALHKAGATLRLRAEGARIEQTFKCGGKGSGALDRGEWNAAASGEAPDPAAFPDEARQALERLLDGAALEPQATTSVERCIRRLRFGGSTVEAAFDFGTVQGGGRSEPIAELELELLEGHPADLFALARKLPLGPELGWSIRSKGERGHALASDARFSAAKARDVALSDEMDVGQGFQAIAWNCLTQILGNYREVIASGNPEAIHQTRVGIRRLRAAFSLFGSRVTDAQSPVFRAEWKAAAAALGPARDLHVLIERVEAAAAARGEDAADLLQSLYDKRAAATAEAQATLAGAPFQHLLIGFAEWLERGMPDAGGPLTQFAAEVLGRRRRKLSRARPIARLSDEALHDLRIKGKKLRYAAEFFAALYPGEEARKTRRSFARAIGKLQDQLGSMHDLAVAHDQREDLFTGLEPICAAGLSAQLSELLESHGPSRRALVRSAAKALDRVAEAPAWWKRAERPGVDAAPD
jgi:triphosphatase